MSDNLSPSSGGHDHEPFNEQRPETPLPDQEPSEEEPGSGSPGPPDSWETPGASGPHEAAPTGSEQPASPGPPPGPDEPRGPQGSESPRPAPFEPGPPESDEPATPDPPPADHGGQAGTQPTGHEHSGWEQPVESQQPALQQERWGAEQQQSGWRAAPPTHNGLGIGALVLGIVGVVFALFPPTFWLGLILGMIGLILGLVGWSRAKREQTNSPGMAIAGVVLSGVAIVVGLFWLLVIVGVLSAMDGGGNPGNGGGGSGYLIAPLWHR